MSGYVNQFQSYQRIKIETASPGELVVMLYDGCISALHQAKTHIRTKNIEQTHLSLIKAQRIINELQSSLRPDLGGQIAENLAALYTFIHGRLVEANLKKDEQFVDEVLRLIVPLRDAWVAAAKAAQAAAPQVQPIVSAGGPQPGAFSAQG